MARWEGTCVNWTVWDVNFCLEVENGQTQGSTCGFNKTLLVWLCPKLSILFCCQQHHCTVFWYLLQHLSLVKKCSRNVFSSRSRDGWQGWMDHSFSIRSFIQWSHTNYLVPINCWIMPQSEDARKLHLNVRKRLGFYKGYEPRQILMINKS